MMVIADPPIISETARERETFKYDALTISTAGLSGPHPPKPIPSTFLSSTPDPGLSAFAQLGLLRLKAGRALVSLFDRRYQHIVAEALRPLPPATDGGGQPEQVWFNGLTFERVTSVCEHVVTGEATSQSVPGTESGLAAVDLPVSIIKHLDADKRFCHIQDPGRQFYAGVPIRSPTGINIGVYCVFDDRPRPQGLDADDVRFMREMSTIIMGYLESKRSHEWYRREQRMIGGLGSFVKGQATLWKWDEGSSAHPASFQDLPGMSEGWLNKKLRPGTAAAEDTTAAISQPNADAVLAAAAPPESKSTPARSPRNATDLLHSNTSRVLSKAANVIRESIEVEGVIFLDASVRSYGGLVGNTFSDAHSPSDAQRSSSGMTSSDEGGQLNSHVLPATSHSVCDVLGFSTSAISSIVGDAPPSEFARFKERSLQRLLRRYPRGKVWNFEVDGTVLDASASSGSDESPAHDHQLPLSSTTPDSTNVQNDPPPQNARKKRRSMAASVIEMFPGARSVAVVPLVDAQTGRWFAGGFAWTRTPTRAFTEENELTYLRVFGLTAMAEVARLKTKAAAKARTDVIGSISHELRSPLHGLVGAVEILKHTILDALQHDILRAIEASGRTLIDTIDHLLDFAKINGRRPSKTRRRSSQAGLGQRPSVSVQAALALSEPPVQLDQLVEEVVESVLAGSTYSTRSEPQVTTPITSLRSPLAAMNSYFIADGQASGQLSKSRDAVQIYLDIDQPANWTFRTHPGAFRRIVMNLFGNSIKFTKSGFIRVSLRQEIQPQRSAMSGGPRVVLSVSDSGKGMSEDYLRNHLFTPFAQEDEFAPGTGLGLSLVRHMTDTLGGTIDVLSKPGQGTTITVMLPLTQVNEQADEEASFWQSLKPLVGQRVQLSGFEHEARARESFFADDAKQKSQYQLVEKICRDMLGMSVVSGHNGDPAPADFVISTPADEPAWSGAESTKGVPRCPHIFVCQDLASAHRLTYMRRREPSLVYEVCFQPIGPRKLARVLMACHRRRQAAQDSETESTLKVKDAIENTHTQQDNEISKLELDSKSLTLQLAQDGHNAIAMEAGFPTPATASEFVLPATQPLLLQPINIPVAQVNAADLAFMPAEPRGRILIADDNPINLKIMAAFVAKLKHPYTTATDGFEALQLYTKAPADYSCMLTDISMPVMDGLESTRRVREFEIAGGHKPVAVIALTGLTLPEIRQDAFASGVDLFLTRPLSLRGLEKALITMKLR